MPSKAKSQAWVVEPRSRKRLFYSDDPIQTGEFIGDNLPRVVELLEIADVLNGKQLFYQGPREDYADYDRMLQEAPPLLRTLVDAWLASGPDLSSFVEQNRKVWGEIGRYWKRSPTDLVPALSGGGAAIAHYPETGQNPQEEALRCFVRIITNPECDRLAGPCARCGSYYVRHRRVAQNKYCSRSCGSRVTAVNATRKRRNEEHADKLTRARKASLEWSTTRHTEQDWKLWVARRAPGISVKFLTRAVSNGELEVPKKRGMR